MDSNAYARLLAPLLGPASAYARLLMRNTADAQDAVQQAALRGWERIQQYDAARPFKGWWFAILRNCCFDMLRANRSRRNEPLDEFVHIPIESADPDLHSLDGALARLSAAHREILCMKYFADLTYDELAEALDVPRGTIMSRLHTARKALAAQLEEKS